MQKESNYELLKLSALERFLTFDQEKLIRRLKLQADEHYIYVEYCRVLYRFSRKTPSLERKDLLREQPWTSADPNETLTLCDLLCHTEKPIVIKGDFVSLAGLNRVQAGTTRSSLASGLNRPMEEFFDGKEKALAAACEKLGGVPAGKGDVAYEIPLFEPIHLRLSFYHSDEDFPPQLTILFRAEICDYLHYETLYYAMLALLWRIKALL